MGDEESRLKERCDYYRRKEDKLRVIKQKLDIVNGEDRFASEGVSQEEDAREALIKEVQADYDRYIKMY